MATTHENDLARVVLGRTATPHTWGSPDQAAVADLLVDESEGFAEQCRRNPRHAADPDRVGTVLCARGIGPDEASGFMRALRNELVTTDGHGGFFVPAARACSPNLHLVGREGDHVKLHTEVLIHVAGYAELVLDQRWPEDRLVFDPFMDQAALDLWGFERGPSGEWRSGRVVFAAEAKSRRTGSDGLLALLHAFQAREENPEAAISSNHERKWDELARLTRNGSTVELLLIAEGCRWWFDADWARNTLRLAPTHPDRWRSPP